MSGASKNLLSRLGIQGGSSSPSICLATGGTGGHVFPAMALAEELEKQGVQPFFITSQRDMTKAWIRQCPYPCYSLPAAPFQKSLAYGKKIFRSLLEARKILKTLSPRAVLAFGGYASFSPALAAVFQGIPLVSLEQNVVPGKVTRLLNPFCRATVLQWEETSKHLMKPGKTKVLGNPLRPLCQPWDREEALSFLGLPKDRLTFLVMGGSQGASSINNVVKESLPLLKNRASEIQWIHLCGEKDLPELKETYSALGFGHYLKAFEEKMGALYGAADLFIGRSGGGAIAEASAAGIPMVLVPYPHAAADHQKANALSTAKRGASLVVEEKEFSPEKLVKILNSLLKEKGKKLRDLSEKSREMGRPEATEEVVKFILRSFHKK